MATWLNYLEIIQHKQWILQLLEQKDLSYGYSRQGLNRKRRLIANEIELCSSQCNEHRLVYIRAERARCLWLVNQVVPTEQLRSESFDPPPPHFGLRN